MCQKCDSAMSVGKEAIEALIKTGRLKDDRNPKERLLSEKLVLAMIRVYAIQDKIQGGAKVFELISEAPVSFWAYIEKHLEEALVYVQEAKIACDMPEGGKAVTH